MSETAETSAQRVNNSPYHQYEESSTPCVTDTPCPWLPLLQIRGVNNYLQHRCRELSTPRISNINSNRCQ
jgi:hypothetical protein